MSLSHKAYVFDHAKFSSELKPVLEKALTTGSTTGLRDFVSTQISSLTDPYEGLPLAEDWERYLESRSVEEYGDVALTKYYDPGADIGLGDQWNETSNWLRFHAGISDDPTLGDVVGPANAIFDPGKLGSYFQSADDVCRNLRHLEQVANRYPTKSKLIDSVLKLLNQSAQARKGLYVTF